MYKMQCVDLNDLDYDWDVFCERENCHNGSFNLVVLNSEYTDKKLIRALRAAGITENICLVEVSW